MSCCVGGFTGPRLAETHRGCGADIGTGVPTQITAVPTNAGQVLTSNPSEIAGVDADVKSLSRARSRLRGWEKT